MSTATIPELDTVYPESDGKPMADDTVQWEWMVLIVEREQLMFLPWRAVLREEPG